MDAKGLKFRKILKNKGYIGFHMDTEPSGGPFSHGENTGSSPVGVTKLPSQGIPEHSITGCFLRFFGGVSLSFKLAKCHYIPAS